MPANVPVHWLTDVQPTQSIALLVSLMPERDRLGESPWAPSPSTQIRLPTRRWNASWEPSSRSPCDCGSPRIWARRGGRHGIRCPEEADRQRSERARPRSAPSPRWPTARSRALDLIIATAQKDTSAADARTGYIALTRKPSPQIVPTLSKLIESDPDNQVKRAPCLPKELPDGQGVPLLIQVVKTTQNAEVRKAAMSSLGQSRDPRAVAFLRTS
jgi:hypothetical protein